MIQEELLQALCLGGFTDFRLKVLIEEGHGKITQRDQRDFGSGLAGPLSGNGRKLLVEGILPEATTEGQDAGLAHECRVLGERLVKIRKELNAACLLAYVAQNSQSIFYRLLGSGKIHINHLFC